jgi:hypothetical protein
LTRKAVPGKLDFQAKRTVSVPKSSPKKISPLASGVMQSPKTGD